MKKKVSVGLRKLTRQTQLAVALAFVAVIGLSSLIAVVDALPPGAGQVQARSITMSTAQPNTNATYLVSFKPASNYTVKGIIVDFCDASSVPIVGDSSCALPTGFSVGTPTVNMSPGTSGVTDIGGTWTAATPNGGRTLKLTNSTGVALTAGTQYDFALTSVHNQTATGTFYARIITYDSDTGDIASYAAGTEGNTNVKDYGGFALSTSTLVNLTAKIMEQLTFCTSGSAITTDCSSTTTPSLTLGHTISAGGPQVLTTDQVDVAQAFSMLSTNATNGAIVRMKANNPCSNGGLSASGGSVCALQGKGTNGTITVGLPTGNPGGSFGMCAAPGSANTTVVAPYIDSSATCATATSSTTTTTTRYGMDNSSPTAVTSTYGSPIVQSTGSVHNETDTYTFAATASDTTPAGVYAGSESFIATGTF